MFEDYLSWYNLDFRPVADGNIKVLLADCNSPPMVGSNSNLGSEYGSSSQMFKDEMEDLKDIVLSTVAEELASMVACSGDQLENIARNHNAGMDEKEMSYVFVILIIADYGTQVDLSEVKVPSGKI